VDASIFECLSCCGVFDEANVEQLMHMPPVCGGVCCLVFCVVLRSQCDSNLLFLLSVCVTSYKGHMVDALASRADEGRTSLR
jgi:hypothetical protein